MSTSTRRAPASTGCSAMKVTAPATSSWVLALPSGSTSAYVEDNLTATASPLSTASTPITAPMATLLAPSRNTSVSPGPGGASRAPRPTTASVRAADTSSSPARARAAAASRSRSSPAAPARTGSAAATSRSASPSATRRALALTSSTTRTWLSSAPAQSPNTALAAVTTER